MRSGYEVAFLLVFFIPIGILRRAVADTLGYLREFSSRCTLLDSHDIDLMPPVVSEVEPVAEEVIDLQAERLNRCTLHASCWLIPTVHPCGEHVPPCLRVHRPFAADLELVHVLVFAVEGVEDGVVKLRERLVAANLDGSGDYFV